MSYFKIVETAARKAKTDLEKHINKINDSGLYDLFYSDKHLSDTYVQTTRIKANKLIDYLEKNGYKTNQQPNEYMGRYEVIETIILKNRNIKGYISIKSLPYDDDLAQIKIIV